MARPQIRAPSGRSASPILPASPTPWTTDTLLRGALPLRQPARGHRVNLDAVLLAAFAATCRPRPPHGAGPSRAPRTRRRHRRIASCRAKSSNAPCWWRPSRPWRLARSNAGPTACRFLDPLRRPARAAAAGWRLLRPRRSPRPTRRSRRRRPGPARGAAARGPAAGYGVRLGRGALLQPGTFCVITLGAAASSPWRPSPPPGSPCAATLHQPRTTRGAVTVCFETRPAPTRPAHAAKSWCCTRRRAASRRSSNDSSAGTTPAPPAARPRKSPAPHHAVAVAGQATMVDGFRPGAPGGRRRRLYGSGREVLGSGRGWRARGLALVPERPAERRTRTGDSGAGHADGHRSVGPDDRRQS